MTAQMCSTPLDDYFFKGGFKPNFSITSTANWRGYRGLWEISEDRLYLISLSGTLDDGNEACLETVFPGFPNRVFAHWHSGELRVPKGQRLKYMHMGFGSIYEHDWFLQIDQGVVVATRVRQNGVAESGSAL